MNTGSQITATDTAQLTNADARPSATAIDTDHANAMATIVCPIMTRLLDAIAAIAPSFGDIFTSNSLKNGLLPIVLPEAVVAELIADLLARPGAEVTVDLPAQTVTLPDGTSHGFEIDPFAKHCLVNGIDELGYTLGLSGAIEAFETSYGGVNG